MARKDREAFLAEHPEPSFECHFCAEDVERDDVVVRHEESGDPDSPFVGSCRRCHLEWNGS